MIHHLRVGDEQQQAQLVATLRGGDRQHFRAIGQQLAQTGSIEYARALAAEYVAAAQRGLSRLPRSDARDALAAVAQFVLGRNR